MSRGRHALPEPPRSDAPLIAVALAVTAATVAAVWLIDSEWVARAGVTGVALVAFLAIWAVSRASRQQAERLAAEGRERRAEQQLAMQRLTEANAQLSQLRTQQVELLLELRALQEAGAQQALQYELLLPRVAEPEPVYPSLQLPLVRAAFSAELAPEVPVEPPAPPSEASYVIEHQDTSGDEPQPPRQLLDLTASEIARLRPAN